MHPRHRFVTLIFACFTGVAFTPLAFSELAFAESTAAESVELDDTSAVSTAPSDDATFHLRLGAGWNPVSNEGDDLPQVHSGFGASLSAFVQLPYRLSVGAGIDSERYTFDSRNTGDPLDAPPRYRDVALTQSRAMGLVQWDVLPRGLINPFLLLGVGYGWEHTKLTSWQCEPALASGIVFGGGAGFDVAVHDVFGIGLEYRGNTLPDDTAVCTQALIDDEPLGAPGDFFSHRLGLTLTARN